MSASFDPQGRSRGPPPPVAPGVGGFRAPLSRHVQPCRAPFRLTNDGEPAGDLRGPALEQLSGNRSPRRTGFAPAAGLGRRVGRGARACSSRAGSTPRRRASGKSPHNYAPPGRRPEPPERAARCSIGCWARRSAWPTGCSGFRPETSHRPSPTSPPPACWITWPAAPAPVALIGVSPMTRRCGLTLHRAGVPLLIVNRTLAPGDRARREPYPAGSAARAIPSTA